MWIYLRILKEQSKTMFNLIIYGWLVGRFVLFNTNHFQQYLSYIVVVSFIGG